jgi:hypothetical protein
MRIILSLARSGLAALLGCARLAAQDAGRGGAVAALPPLAVSALATPSANVLPYSRLPLGSANGWGCYQESDGVTDAVATGERGLPALWLKSKGLTSTFCCGVVPVPATPASYTWRFRAKGLQPNASLRPRCTAEYAPLAEQSFELPEGVFTTAELTFTTPAPAACTFIYLTLQVTGDVIIDSLALGPSAEIRNLDLYTIPQVVFALPRNTAAAAARLVFADEPLAVDYYASGFVGKAVLKTRLVTAYGDAFPLPEVQLDRVECTGSFDLLAALPAQRRLGSFRIEGHLEQDGKVISAEQEYVLHRLPRPRYWGVPAPQSAFGIASSIDPTRLTMCKAIGLNWLRTVPGGDLLSWYALEPRKGQWDWAATDAKMALIRKHHFSLLAILATTPGWASVLPPDQAGAIAWSLPRDLNDYREYVRQVAQRYRDSIDAYDVWNEPWYTSMFAGSLAPSGAHVFPDQPASVFADLAKVVFETVRELDPGAPVVALGLGSGKADDASPVLLSFHSIENWDSLVMRAGVYDRSDVIYGHMYLDSVPNLFPGDRVEALRTTVKGTLDYFGLKPKSAYWNTEGSPMQSTLKQGLHLRTFPYAGPEDFLHEGDLMARYLASSHANGIDKTFLYSAAVQWYAVAPIHFNTLCVGGGWMHPVGVAIAVATSNLEGTTVARRSELAAGVYATFYAGAGRGLAALSTAPEFAPWRLPATLPPTVRATDVFGNPVPAGQPMEGRMLWLHGESIGALATLLAH